MRIIRMKVYRLQKGKGIYMKKFASLLMAAAMIAILAACGSVPDAGSTDNIILPEDGLAKGDIGEIMRTYWFDFTVNDSFLCNAFSEYTASEGNELLAVEMTLENTFSETLPMRDNDFWVQWNEDSEDAFAYPLKAVDAANSEVLPDSYDLNVNGSVTGFLLFEVPSGYTEFAIVYLEINSEEETGDAFIVHLLPESR